MDLPDVLLMSASRVHKQVSFCFTVCFKMVSGLQYEKDFSALQLWADCGHCSGTLPSGLRFSQFHLEAGGQYVPNNTCHSVYPIKTESIYVQKDPGWNNQKRVVLRGRIGGNF